MPHRRRRPQSLSRFCGADRRGPRGDRGEAGARAGLRRRRLSRQEAREIPKTLREATELLRQVEDAARRRSATMSSTTMSTPPMGAVRIRPPGHRLGVEARFRDGRNDTVRQSLEQVRSHDRDGQDRLARSTGAFMPSGRSPRGAEIEAARRRAPRRAQRRMGARLPSRERASCCVRCRRRAARDERRDRAGARLADGPAGPLWRREARRRGARRATWSRSPRRRWRRSMPTGQGRLPPL